MPRSAPVDCEPLTPLLPAHPPDAVQEVALEEDHFNAAEPPELIVLGVALKLTDGAGADIDTVVD